MWSSVRVLPVTRQELNLDVVLRCGQSFRWKLTKDSCWLSTLRGQIYRLRQSDKGVEYQVWLAEMSQNGEAKADRQFPPGSPEDTLRDFLQLDVSLTQLYKKWTTDPLFRGDILPGVRILRQEPLECLMSFILSSCNNISRISQMVDKLCGYGPQLAVVDGVPYHDFPCLENLVSVGAALELKLRQAGFGYRAVYVAKAIRSLSERGGEKWLRGLRDAPYESARAELMTLAGVGRKVADCVCLMSLNKPVAVPVDTHVFQIARQHMDSLKHVDKCSPTVYPRIVEWFTSRFGEWSGWAQGVLFASRVRQDSLKSEVVHNNNANYRKGNKRKRNDPH